MRERELHSCFYICSLNHKAASSLPGQPEPHFCYIQKFYKSHIKITLLNKGTHKIFDSHKNLDIHPARITLTDLMVFVPSQPYMCSSSYSQAKMPLKSTKIFKQRVAAVYCKEREFSIEE